MKKFILLSFCTLVSCQKVNNPANCSVNDIPCATGEVCDTFSGTCKPEGFPALTLVSISPASGSQIAATQITITGSDFKEGITVQVGDKYATAVKVESSTKLTALTPISPNRCGPVRVLLTNPDGKTAEKAEAFRYTSLGKFATAVSGTTPNTTLMGAQLIFADMNGDQQEDLVVKDSSNLRICTFNTLGQIQCGGVTDHSLGAQSFITVVYFDNDKQGILLTPYNSDTVKEGVFYGNSKANPPSFTSSMPYKFGKYRIYDILPVNRPGPIFNTANAELWVSTSEGVGVIPYALANLAFPSYVPISPTPLQSMTLTRAQTATVSTQVAGIVPSNAGLAVIQRSPDRNALVFNIAGLSRLRVADLNRDGYNDVIGSLDNGTKFYSSLGQASGDYPAPSVIQSAAATSSAFEIADLYCDGYPGLVVTKGKTLEYVPGLPGGTFGPQVALPTAPADVSQFVIKDVNQDGRPDLVYVTSNGSLLVALNSPS